MRIPFSFIKNALHSSPPKDKAFLSCYEEYYHEVQRFALNLVHDLPIAEIIAGDSFIKLYRDWDKKEGDVHRRNFLFVTARNAALDHLKRNPPSFAELRETLSQADAESEDLVGAMLGIFYHYYEHLSAGEREVVDLLLIGKQYDEIARILNKKIGTVVKLRHDAVKKLRRLCNAQELKLLLMIFLLFRYTDNQRFKPGVSQACQDIKKIFDLGGNKHRGMS